MRRPFAVAVGIALIAAAAGIAWFVLRDDDEIAVKADCGPGDAARLDEASPGLANRAASMTEEAGNRTWRWDFQVDDACQAQDASVAVDVRPGQRLEGCGAVTYYASVTSGVSEREIDLGGESVLHGQATVTPARPDLQAGNGSFVVSLAATMPTSGLELQDEQCLDAAVNGFTLHAAFARA